MYPTVPNMQNYKVSPDFCLCHAEARHTYALLSALFFLPFSFHALFLIIP